MPNSLYTLYMRYGEDYVTPCQNFAIDTLNDAATQYDAFSYFSQSDQIRLDMMKELNRTLAENCYSNLQFFQLSNIDLPNDFEMAIDNTQQAIQEIKTSETDLINVQIELNTTVSQASIQSSVIVNNADATAQAAVMKNNAAAQSLYNLVSQQSEAYGLLKSELGMTSA